MRVPPIAVLPTLFTLLAGCANRGESPGDDEAARGEERTHPEESARQERAEREVEPEPTHRVYSLADNRLAAHRSRAGGLLVPAGSAGFAKYLRYERDQNPWALREEREGVPVARMPGPRADLRVPLDAEAAEGDTLALRVYSPVEREISIRVGSGEGVERLSANVAEGWSAVEVEAEEGPLFAVGENDVELIRGPGPPLDLAEIRFGGDPDGGGPEAGEASPPLFRDGALILRDSEELAYHVMIPEKGRLEGEVEGACEVAIGAETDDGDRVTGSLGGAEGEESLDLSAVGGRPARLTLGARECEEAELRDAGLAIPGEAPEVDRDGDPPEHVILWIMDSLRADRVRPFGFPDARPEVPVFEELAEDAAVFQQAYVQGTESRASHASIWASLYAAAHGMPHSRDRLGGAWRTLDATMKEAEKFTSGVTANGYVISRWGFGDAWDRYRNHIHLEAGLKGEDILSRGLASIDDVDDPWFLYLGTIDTHVSWRAKDPWIDKYYPDDYEGRFKRVAPGPVIDRIAAGEESITDGEIERIRAIYDSNVSYQDELLGELLEDLEDRGIADETMIVITADHGDELWETGRVGHGSSLRDTVVHVPLLIHYPPLFPGGPVSEGAEVVDILPTLADALELEPDDDWQGESLLPLAHGAGQGYPRMSLSSLYESTHAARVGAWKVRVNGDEEPRLFNLEDDPEEMNDVSGDHPRAARMVTDALWTLRAYNAEWDKREWGNAANARAGLTEALGE